MAKESAHANDTSNREIVVTRLLNAPRELVFKVFTDPEHIVKWWGPNGFTTTINQMELKPGGVWRFTMHGPDGTDFPNRIVYTEIVKNEKLAYKHDSDGAPDAIEFEVTVTFEKQGDKTFITMRSLFPTVEMLQHVVKNYGALEGAEQNLNRLSEHLNQMSVADLTDRGFTVSRTYNAPRELVFKAWTDAKHMATWWGPKGSTINVLAFDPRPGGKFHYHLKMGTMEMWAQFVYREVWPPKKIVFVSSFTDAKGNIVPTIFFDNWPLEVLNIVSFTEEQGKTTLNIWAAPFNASEEQHKMFESQKANMQAGYKGTFDKLEDLLETIK